MIAVGILSALLIYLPDRGGAEIVGDFGSVWACERYVRAMPVHQGRLVCVDVRPEAARGAGP